MIAKDAIRAGEVEVAEPDVLDGLFLETVYPAAGSGAARSHVVNADVAKHRRALRDRLGLGLDIIVRQDDGRADVGEFEVRRRNVLHARACF
jgi:hypothetical protein